MPVSNSASGFGVVPFVVSAQQLTATSFLVNFSEPMAATGLTTIGNYTLTALGASLARTVTLVAANGPTSVIVTVNAALSVGSPAYSIQVLNVLDLSGNQISAISGNTATFNVVGAPTATPISRDGGTLMTLAISYTILCWVYLWYVVLSVSFFEDFV